MPPTAVKQSAASWQERRMSRSMRGVMSSIADKTGTSAVAYSV
jgi:hypothetical protein